MYDIVKILITASLIVLISEISKSNAILGGFIKSLPLVSLLAFMWVYVETHDTDKIATLAFSTFWFVLPTLPMFLVLPYLLKRGYPFYLSLSIAIMVMLLCYGVTLFLLKWFHVSMD